MASDIITEDMTVYQVIKKYPETKDVLIKMNPVFKKLNNPIMFNTVAKVTPLKKAAQVGKIYIKQMLLELNEAIGKREEYLSETKKNIFKAKNEMLNMQFNNGRKKEKPDWLSKMRDTKVFDYSKTDEEPFLKVTNFASTLDINEGFILKQNFEPLPLINYLQRLGFDYYTEKVDNNIYKIYFYKVKQGEINGE